MQPSTVRSPHVNAIAFKRGNSSVEIIAESNIYVANLLICDSLLAPLRQGF